MLETALTISFFSSCFCRLFKYQKVYSILKATNDFSGSRNDYIKQIKKRYIDCHTLGKPINNSSVFARKVLDNYLSGQAVFSGLQAASSCLFYIFLWMGYSIYHYDVEKLVFAGILFLGSTLAMSYVFDSKAVSEKVINASIDFLDNTLKNRLEVNIEENRREKFANKPVSHVNVSNDSPLVTPPAASIVPAFTHESGTMPSSISPNELIASILDDFL